MRFTIAPIRQIPGKTIDVGRNHYYQWITPNDTGSRVQVKLSPSASGSGALYLTSTMPNQRSILRNASISNDGTKALSIDRTSNIRNLGSAVWQNAYDVREFPVQYRMVLPTTTRISFHFPKMRHWFGALNPTSSPTASLLQTKPYLPLNPLRLVPRN